MPDRGGLPNYQTENIKRNTLVGQFKANAIDIDEASDRVDQKKVPGDIPEHEKMMKAMEKQLFDKIMNPPKPEIKRQ